MGVKDPVSYLLPPPFEKSKQEEMEITIGAATTAIVVETGDSRYE